MPSLTANTTRPKSMRKRDSALATQSERSSTAGRGTSPRTPASCSTKHTPSPLLSINVPLSQLRKVKDDPRKTPFIAERLINARRYQGAFGSRFYKAWCGLAEICGLMQRSDCLSVSLNIQEKGLELSIGRGKIQILRLLKGAKPEEITEALSSPLFPLIDDPNFTIESVSENLEESDGIQKNGSLDESMARWKSLAACFNNVPECHREPFQFEVAPNVAVQFAKEMRPGLGLCPWNADYDPEGNHADDDEILIEYAAGAREAIMKAGNPNSEIVLRCAHKDVDDLLKTCHAACEAFTSGFIKLTSISKVYLTL